MVSPSVMSFIILNNVLTGEMETTIVHTFIKAGKLKRWLSRPDCPPVIKECKILFDKAYAPKVHDVGEIDDDRDSVFVETLFADDHPVPCVVPDELRHFTKKAKAVVASYMLFPLLILVTVSYTSTCMATDQNCQYQVV